MPGINLQDHPFFVEQKAGGDSQIPLAIEEIAVEDGVGIHHVVVGK